MLGCYDFVAIDLLSDEPVAKVPIEVGKSGTNNTRAMTALLPEQAG